MVLLVCFPVLTFYILSYTTIFISQKKLQKKRTLKCRCKILLTAIIDTFRFSCFLCFYLFIYIFFKKMNKSSDDVQFHNVQFLRVTTQHRPSPHLNHIHTKPKIIRWQRSTTHKVWVRSRTARAQLTISSTPLAASRENKLNNLWNFKFMEFILSRSSHFFHHFLQLKL